MTRFGHPQGCDQEPKITRVDMKQHPTGVAVLKYPDGWTAGTNPVDAHLNTTTSLVEMVAWFKERGWIVREWPGGARAFLGRQMPVRTRQDIIRLRSEMSRGLYFTRGVRPDNLQLNALDLAVDL